MHRHEIEVLKALKEPKRLNFDSLLDKAAIGKDEALWAIANLSQMNYIKVSKAGEFDFSINEEGMRYANGELPELSLIRRIGIKGIDVGALKSKEGQIGFSWAKRKRLVEISGRMLKLTESGKKAAREGMEADSVLKELRKGKENYEKYRDSEAIRELEQRRLVEVRSRETIKEVEITQQGILALAKERQTEEPAIEALDRNAIKNRLWSGKKFRPYNVLAPVEPAGIAVRHPLRRFISDIRQAYLSLGFEEVSGPVIDSSFWVFDYLFVPQHHPARDVQDTFFLSRPREMPLEEKELVARMKREHENAWHSEWSEATARQAVPRTHMTSVTGRYMHRVIEDLKKDPDSHELPMKLFTVGRVFRNENVDYKHLADFYQMDGIIIGKQLTLANLFDVLLKLYGKLGIKISFKPAYFPFVEPGVECYTNYNGRDLELFGAGLIRREITGIERKSINVLAWGPGVERIMLLKNLGIESISSMYGAGAGWLRNLKME